MILSRILIFSYVFLLSFSAYALEVKTKKDSQGWQLLVNGEPYLIKGMCYYPDAIGESPNDNTRRNWVAVDDDQDGRNDYAYQTWVDKNLNNRKDDDEPEVGDFQLMKDMGVNTIRLYHHVSDDPDMQELNKASSKQQNYSPAIEKAILAKLYAEFGIMTAMGDLIGSYTVSTGADWKVGTDYTDPVQRAHMLRSVEEMVRTYKDEPYILMWILGNENNYGEFTHTNASQELQVYARFVNEAALLIKKIDPSRPVALCNGGYQFLEYYNQYAPAVDIIGLNFYSNYGFHELWKKTETLFDRPIMLTEYGTGYPIVVDGKHDEKAQVRVHRLSWLDIEKHQYGQEKPGNAIGGFVFSWNDNWWEDGDQWQQNINPNGSGWNHEYNGMMSFGDGSSGSLTRQPRAVYELYQELWKAKFLKHIP